MQHVIPGCRPEPPDELSSKGIHLTFAALVPGELTHESLLRSARVWAQDSGGLIGSSTSMAARNTLNLPTHGVMSTSTSNRPHSPSAAGGCRR